MKIIRRFVIKKLLNRQFDSQILRDLFFSEHGISVGLYSYGCFAEQRIARGTVIGRYCSFSPTSYVFNGNHGVDFISTHPYLYNTSLGMVAQETISRNICVIGDDVWVGHNVAILPSVSHIGRGSVIAAGALVTKDVPPYAIVGGNPARVIRYRFSEDIICKIEASRWWEWSKDELLRRIQEQPDMVFKPAIHFLTSKNSL